MSPTVRSLQRLVAFFAVVVFVPSTLNAQVIIREKVTVTTKAPNINISLQILSATLEVVLPDSIQAGRFYPLRMKAYNADTGGEITLPPTDMVTIEVDLRGSCQGPLDSPD